MNSLLIILIASLAPAGVDDIVVNQTIICKSTACPSCPCPPFVPGEPLSSELLLKAMAVAPKPVWFNLRTFAWLTNAGTPNVLSAYYRALHYDVTEAARLVNLYEYCLEPDEKFLGASCTVIRTVVVKMRIWNPQTHPLDRDVDGKIGSLDAAYFIHCWHGLGDEYETDACEGTVGIPPNGG